MRSLACAAANMATTRLEASEAKLLEAVGQEVFLERKLHEVLSEETLQVFPEKRLPEVLLSEEALRAVRTTGQLAPPHAKGPTSQAASWAPFRRCPWGC